MLSPLIKNRNFCYLWTGQLISSLGDRLTQMGILTFVMVSSQDKGDKMALITFFGLLPFLLFGPLFGVLVDRYSRKNLMILADLARALLVLGIPIIWANTHSVLAMICWFFILGTFTALFTPAKMSIITNITDKGLLLQANSLIVTTGMISTLVGTLIAGALIKATGARMAFYINGLTYFVSALLIYKIVYQRPEQPVGQPKTDYGVILADIKSGLAYVARHQLILQLILLSCMFSVISSFAYILILNYGTTALRQGPLGMGWLLSSAGFGMVAGSALLIKKKDKVCYERVLYFSYLGIGITCLSFFFLAPGVFLTSLILFCAGIAAAVLTITLDTIFQRVTPDELKGKIFAVRGVVSNAVFLGCLLLVGLLVKYISAPKIFFLVGIVSILTALRILLYEKRWGYQLICVCLRALMKYLFALKVSGGENLPSSRRVILAGNHTSIMDGAVVAAAYPGRIYFLVADTIFKTRIWGWVVKRLGYISIKRGGFNKEAIKEAVAILKSGYSICIFPEGKISADDKLNPGKEGIALIARLANVDIIPFAIEGAHEAWPLPEKFPKRFPVEIRFGSPVDTKDYSLSEELVSEVMEDIAQIKLHLEREGYLRVEPNKIIEHLINIG